MRGKSPFTLNGIIGWFILVFIISLFVFPAYSDYIAMAQVSEALSIISSQKARVVEYYEKNQHCPTTQDLISSPLDGKHLKSVKLRTLESSDSCYIVTTMRQNSSIDRRIRGKSIMLVMQPVSSWTSQVTCETNLSISIDDCQITSFEE